MEGRCVKRHRRSVPNSSTGTFVPMRYLGDARVSSVMIEIRRDTYLDESTARPHDGEPRIRSLVIELARRLAAATAGEHG